MSTPFRAALAVAAALCVLAVSSAGAGDDYLCTITATSTPTTACVNKYDGGSVALTNNIEYPVQCTHNACVGSVDPNGGTTDCESGTRVAADQLYDWGRKTAGRTMRIIVNPDAGESSTKCSVKVK